MTDTKLCQNYAFMLELCQLCIYAFMPKAMLASSGKAKCQERTRYLLEKAEARENPEYYLSVEQVEARWADTRFRYTSSYTFVPAMYLHVVVYM